MRWCGSGWRQAPLSQWPNGATQRVAASDRTSCRSAAYWLMLPRREALPKAQDLAGTEFATFVRLIKITARVIETARRVRLAFVAPPPSRSFAGLAGTLPPPLGHKGG